MKDPNGAAHQQPADAQPRVRPSVYARQQYLALEDLAKLSQYCAEREAAAEQRLSQRQQQVREHEMRARRRITEQRDRQAAVVQRRMETEPPQIEQKRSAARAEADRLYQADREELKDREEQAERKIRKKLESDLWMADSLHEMRITAAAKEHGQAANAFKRRGQELRSLYDRVSLQFYRHRVKPPEVAEQVEQAAESVEPAEDYTAERDQLKAKLEALPRTSPVLLCSEWSYPLATLPGFVAVLVAALLIEPAAEERGDLAMIFGGALAGGLVLGFAVMLGLRRRARRRLHETWDELCPRLAALHAKVHADKHEADQRHEQQRGESTKQHKADREHARQKHAPLLEKYTARRKQVTEQIETRYKQRCDRITAEADGQLAALRRWQEERTERISGQYDRRMALLEDRTRSRLDAAQAEADAVYEQLRQRWSEGTQRVRDVIGQTDQLPRVYRQGWDREAWSDWTAADAAADAAVVRIGRFRIEPDRLTRSKAASERYRMNLPRSFELPAVLGFGEQGSLVVEHDAAGREGALQILRTTVARLLVTLPPSAVRFTFIDPIGLGQTFAGFMHLADFHEQIVGQRIWTETEHIHRRLAEMTEHMETVIQKYLRNEFETIDRYNAQAGQLAEPYRFVVIADFPQNIDDAAARRLHAIVTSGARCGVYVLMACDRRQPVPAGLTMEDLRGSSTTLAQQEDGRFAWRDEPFCHYPLELDEPPTDELLSETVRRVGMSASEGDRVEMPFDTIAPRPDEYWSGDCTDELRVPIGRSGATRLQELRLGKGVAQHALLAGKTGSGKSTLLHAMITNLALWYSPEQVAFYLVDFKKGVEFKTYATHRLPHARAVAVESDREFGLSVLRRLDAELERRGELFRSQGVQLLGEYRRAVPDEPMPRTLLIVDEFQELFSEDDRLAQDAALLLDRLVRQGRAFGIHVLLGSQTLAGGGGLSRSTIGQMAIRVALQCNEADSQLIFEDTNAAARLLTRPGEAIYNDASGAIEGNNPFQVAWLDEPLRERYLGEASRLAAERFPDAEPPIVFEGSAAADARANRAIADLLRADDWPAAPTEPQVWLGEPITIKSPTAAVLARRSGSNVLLVGQRDDAAAAMFAVSMIGLAAQHRPETVEFFVFDATPADAAHAQVLRRVADGIPHKARVVEPAETDAVFQQLNDELVRRQNSTLDPAQQPACYIYIVGLQSYRTLRRAEDDFSFSFRDEDEPPAASSQKVFAELLREGPSLGMHVLTWCDTPIAVDRVLDRTALREFDWRVLFQMSATDSANLIESADAAQLGLYRALLHSEEQGIFEKFRPYEPPDTAWLDRVRSRLASRRSTGSGPPGDTLEVEHER